jgi:uncharacterized protein HemX
MKQALYYIAALLILVALGAGAYGVYSYRSMTERVEKLEGTAQQLDDLTQRFATFSKEVAYRRDLDSLIRNNRDRVTHELETTAREDQPTAAFLDTPLPTGLRDAYNRAKQQRLPVPDRN